MAKIITIVRHLQLAIASGIKNDTDLHEALRTFSIHSFIIYENLKGKSHTGGKNLKVSRYPNDPIKSNQDDTKSTAAEHIHLKSDSGLRRQGLHNVQRKLRAGNHNNNRGDEDQGIHHFRHKAFHKDSPFILFINTVYHTVNKISVFNMQHKETAIWPKNALIRKLTMQILQEDTRQQNKNP